MEAARAARVVVAGAARAAAAAAAAAAASRTNTDRPTRRAGGCNACRVESRGAGVGYQPRNARRAEQRGYRCVERRGASDPHDRLRRALGGAARVSVRVARRRACSGDVPGDGGGGAPPAAEAAAAASDTEDDIFVAPCQPAAKKNGVGRRHSGRHVAATKEDGGAVSEYTECGIGKPRIQSLRSYLNTKLHTLFLTPDCADSAFHSLNGRITFFESVVKRVGKVGHADVQTLLKELMVPEKSDGSKPSPKKLKLWLGKALNNVRNNLKKVTVRVWAEVTGYVGTKK